MSEIKLNFNEGALDQSSTLYKLYSMLLVAMTTANSAELPDYTINPPMKDGEIDVEAIKKNVEDISLIQTKNSAYSMANAIVLSVGSGSSGSGAGAPGPDCLSRLGDSMLGAFNALYGFQAGDNGIVALRIYTDTNDSHIARFVGNLIVDKNIDLTGQLNVSNTGIYFSGQQSIFYKDNALHISSQQINLKGSVTVDNPLQVGTLVISDDGIYSDNHEYYHSGNSNNNTANWSAKDMHVYGSLIVDGKHECSGTLSALNDFELGKNGTKLLYANTSQQVQLGTDLCLYPGKGIVYDGKHIIQVREGDNNTISLSAPGKVLNLGDSDGGTLTTHIALQAAIKTHNDDYAIISQYGDGDFRNSFSAGCGNAGDTVMQTYYTTTNDYGVVFPHNIRLGSSNGPIINTKNGDGDIVFIMPYTHTASLNYTPQIERLSFDVRYADTTSLFKDSSLTWSASLQFNTDAEFFVFKKPVESTSFEIISDKYKTRLSENALFFGDFFIEGSSDGFYLAGNTYYRNNLSSLNYASGFAGYGWGVIEDKLLGGYTATFDELTIRKKMRVYEMEVQKHSTTNGALWVSDSCSGDLVEEIV